MRPTYLQFRSPNEKTPAHYDVTSTFEGDTLNFKSKSLNKRPLILPKEKRFLHYH